MCIEWSHMWDAMMMMMMIQSIRLLISYSYRKVVTRQFYVSKTDKSSFIHIFLQQQQKWDTMRKKNNGKKSYRATSQIHRTCAKFQKERMNGDKKKWIHCFYSWIKIDRIGNDLFLPMRDRTLFWSVEAFSFLFLFKIRD